MNAYNRLMTGLIEEDILRQGRAKQTPMGWPVWTASALAARERGTSEWHQSPLRLPLQEQRGGDVGKQSHKKRGFLRQIIWKSTHLTSEKEEVEHTYEVKAESVQQSVTPAKREGSRCFSQWGEWKRKHTNDRDCHQQALLSPPHSALLPWVTHRQCHRERSGHIRGG